MAGVKIVDLPALGRDLINTDLLEVSLNGGGSRKITGQEIMNASKLAIGSTPIVAGTVGRLLFQGTGNVLQQSGNLFWDNPNLRLGIGISTPLYTLDVAGNIHGNSIFAEYNIVSTAGNVWLSNGYAIGDYGTGNNRIEFYSNRLSFFGNGNEALRIVGSTGNLLVNTTTDAGFKLDVNGTARVVATHQIYRNNQVGAIDLNLYNGQSGWQGGMYYNTGAGGAGQRLTFYAGGAGGSADGLTIFSNRNVLIQNGGTHTDAGFMLDVNGTARVQGQLSLGITGTAGRVNFARSSNGTMIGAIYTSGNDLIIENASQGMFFNSIGAERMRLAPTTGNLLINTTTDAGFRLDVNGTARVKTTDTSTPLNIAHSGSVGIQIEANANGYRMRLASTSTFSDISTPDSYLTLNQSGQRVVIGSSTIYNSAQLAVDSTTRGFLPPRMTNAQRAAIASPAVGLIVYCTDATEGLYVYKSTGWTFMV